MASSQKKRRHEIIDLKKKKNLRSVNKLLINKIISKEEDFLIMLLVDRLKTSLTSDVFSPLALHFVLAFGVAVYTLCGALVMQWLESPGDIQPTIVKREAIMNNTTVGGFVHYDQLAKKSLRNADWKQVEPPETTATRVFLGPEIADIDPQVHNCVQRALLRLLKRSDCENIDWLIITPIDLCYQNADFNRYFEERELFERKPKKKLVAAKRKTKQQLIDEDVEVELNKWSFENAIIFAFTVITTIGYGHVAPETFYGRLFCILYGVVGVPITLLTIADMGMFISMLLRKFTQFIRSIPRITRKLFKCLCRRRRAPHSTRSVETTPKIVVSNGVRELEEIIVDEEGEDEEEAEGEEDQSAKKADESICLCVVFFLYLMFGAKVLASYEPDMEYFEAFYFNFVTLTTIGLGDFVPKSYEYLFVTLCYIGIGLALTTMSVEIAADALKKLHYFGRKIDNVANTMVWFGGKKMTMKALVKNLADQLNIPVEEMEKFDINQFVGDAIKVEAGEKETLRRPSMIASEASEGVADRALSYRHIRRSTDTEKIHFADDRLSANTGRSGPPLALETARTVSSIPTIDGVERAQIHKGINRLNFGPSINSASTASDYGEDYDVMTPKEI